MNATAAPKSKVELGPGLLALAALGLLVAAIVVVPNVDVVERGQLSSGRALWFFAAGVVLFAGALMLEVGAATRLEGAAEVVASASIAAAGHHPGCRAPEAGYGK